MAALLIILLSCLTTSLSYDLKTFFENVNKETAKFNSIGAEIAWESSINPGNRELITKSTNYQKNRIIWQHKTCDELATLFNSQLLNSTQRRQSYLLCRGPKFTFDEARLISNIYEELQSIYSDAEICIPNPNNLSPNNLTDIAILNYLSKIKRFLRVSNKKHLNPIPIAAKMAIYGKFKKKDVLCLKGEEDFDKIMRSSKNENVLRWIWLVWREKVGPPMKEPFRRLVNIENLAARRNGYPNIGAAWRDELEIPGLRQLSRDLYESIRPFYSLLHGIVRFYLRRFYGDVVPERGLIPAHLLGSLWSQNWEPLADLMLKNDIDLDQSIRMLNWTVKHMVKRAEDFYQSMGLPAMTDKFWRESVFERKNNSNARCHGTAADMFKDDDYRLLYCSGTSKEDLYVLHHEIGHIQYYMAYAHQPALFRQANSAFHETIGDSIMYGVLTPQHLNRLNLINDTLLYTGLDTDDSEDNNVKDGIYIKNNDQELKREESKDNLDPNFYKDKHFINYKEYVKHDNKVNEGILQRTAKPKDDATNKQSDDSKNEYISKVIDRINKRDSQFHLNNGIFQTNSNPFDDTPDIKITNREIHDKGNLLHNLLVNKAIYNNIGTLNQILDFKTAHKFVDNTRTEQNQNKFSTKFESIKLFDEELTPDLILLLKQALNKIPQIPFSLLMDEYRWRYFEGSLGVENKGFWEMVMELQGVGPPSERGEEYFDVGAKFHVADNTPYIRYFLSSFLQHQLFESLCKAAVFGHRNAKEPLPKTIAVNRCDIYGSKAAGKLLKDFLSRGHSQHWSEILQATIGENSISASALHRYYRPLYRKLETFVNKHRIPIGW